MTSAHTWNSPLFNANCEACIHVEIPRDPWLAHARSLQYAKHTNSENTVHFLPLVLLKEKSKGKAAIKASKPAQNLFS